MQRECPFVDPHLLPEWKAQMRLDISHTAIRQDAAISPPTLPLMQKANGSILGDYTLTFCRLMAIPRA